MRTSKFGAYLAMVEKEPISFFRVQWGVLALQVCSMPPLILLWVAGTKEEKVSVCVCGRRRGLGLASIFNLCTAVPKHS